MKRFLILSTTIVIALLSMVPMGTGAVQAKADKVRPANFHATITGSTVYADVAGTEPDFDLIVRIIIIAHVHAKGLPPLNLLLDAYIEQFQVDTQPVLPDLINRNKQLSSTLGGFFSGKAMVVGPSNQILFQGNMLAEALIRPICMYATGREPPQCRTEIQHMLVSMQGQGAAKGGSINLKSSFTANQGTLRITSGGLWGRVNIPASAIRALRKGSGSMAKCQEPPAHPKTPLAKKQAQSDRKCINQILNDFSVPRPIMRGTAGSGQPSHGYCFRGQCTNNSSSTGTKPSGGGGSGGSGGTTVRSSRPGWMAPTGVALIVLALLLFGFYLWQTRRDRKLAKLRKGLPSTAGEPGNSPS